MTSEASFKPALNWIEGHSDTGSARVLARLVVSQAFGGHFALDDCRGSLDSVRMALAEAVVAAAGTESLRDAAEAIRANHAELLS